MKTSLTFLLGLCAVSISAAEPLPTDWPQWRGPTRDGKVPTEDIWPDSLGESSLKKKWSFDLGPSYSGPIVLGDLVIATETIDKQSERVTAFNRNTGEKAWEAEWEGAMKVPFFAARNGSWIRATPATDGSSLLVAGIRDVLVSLDVKTGKENWRFDFSKELNTPLPSFGMVCSPLLDTDAVYVQAGAGFCKLDKASGKLIWRTATDKGGMFGSAFSSPVRANITGRDLFVVQSRTDLQLINAQSGKLEASQPVKAFRGMNILTPTVIGDSIFTSAYGGRSHLFAVSETGGKLTFTEKWSTKHQGYMSSPLVIDGVIYNHLRNQRLHALNVSNGAELWDKSSRFGKYWSMVSNGRKILGLDENGKLHLLKPNQSEFEALDSRRIADNTWAHLAVSKGQLFVRELDRLTVYDWSNGARPLAQASR